MQMRPRRGQAGRRLACQRVAPPTPTPLDPSSAARGGPEPSDAWRRRNGCGGDGRRTAASCLVLIPRGAQLAPRQRARTLRGRLASVRRQAAVAAALLLVALFRNVGEASNPGPRGLPAAAWGFDIEEHDDPLDLGWFERIGEPVLGATRDGDLDVPFEVPPDDADGGGAAWVEGVPGGWQYDYEHWWHGGDLVGFPVGEEAMGEDVVDYQMDGDERLRRQGEHRAALGHFVESRRFEGPKDGMVFKTGECGLGYYRDCVTRHLLELDRLVPPDQGRPSARTIALADVVAPPPRSAPPGGHSDHRRWWDYYVNARRAEEVPMGDDSDSDQYEDFAALQARDDLGMSTAVRGRRPRRVRPPRRRRRRRDQPQEALPSTWPTSVEDTRHRRCGLWAIDTVNPNSSRGALVHLQRTGADFCMLQEVRRKSGPHSLALQRRAAEAGWSLATEEAHVLPSGRCSAGVGVAARSCIGMAEPPYRVMESGRTRVKLAWVGGVCRGGLHLISAYLWPAEGMTERNLGVLHSIAAVVHALRGPWVLAWDANMDPKEIMATGWLAVVRGVVVAPQQPTCNDSINDYFVVSEMLHPAVRGISVLLDGFFSHTLQCGSTLRRRRGACAYVGCQCPGGLPLLCRRGACRRARATP